MFGISQGGGILIILYLGRVGVYFYFFSFVTQLRRNKNANFFVFLNFVILLIKKIGQLLENVVEAFRVSAGNKVTPKGKKQKTKSRGLKYEGPVARFRKGGLY